MINCDGWWWLVELGVEVVVVGGGSCRGNGGVGDGDGGGDGSGFMNWMNMTFYE